MKRTALILALSALWSCSQFAPNPGMLEEADPIWPDYMNVTVPVNIAPLNFDYPNGTRNTRTEFRAGGESRCFRGAKVRWTLRAWRRFTAAAAGSSICVTSTDPDTSWVINVLADSIDWGLEYRRIAPGYQVGGEMSIRSRNLSDFSEHFLIRTVFESEGCVNCHEHNRGNPDYMSLHLRGYKGATFIRNGGEDICAYNTKTDSTISACVYPYWHPSGRFIVYSTAKTYQHFLTDRLRYTEVFDKISDMVVFDLDAGELITSPSLSNDTYLETFPSFSPDGGTLYFSRALASDPEMERHYKIYAISFDAATRSFGDDLRLVFDPGDDRSASLVRPSYDGRYLMFTVAPSGYQHVSNPASDMWILDLATGDARAMNEINSTGSEGFHNFDSGSRWFVFASRRLDKLVSHLYISYLQPDGTATKAFILPQKNPLQYYSRETQSFNCPCFVTDPVDFDVTDALEKIKPEKLKKTGYRCAR